LASGATLPGPLNVAVERMRTAFLEMLKKNEPQDVVTSVDSDSKE
jgi:hypothetical protein